MTNLQTVARRPLLPQSCFAGTRNLHGDSEAALILYTASESTNRREENDPFGTLGRHDESRVCQKSSETIDSEPKICEIKTISQGAVLKRWPSAGNHPAFAKWEPVAEGTVP